MIDLMIDPIAEYVDSLEEQGDGFAVEMAEDMTMLTLDVVGAALERAAGVPGVVRCEQHVVQLPERQVGRRCAVTASAVSV